MTRNVDDLEPIAVKLMEQMDADGALDDGHAIIARYSIAVSLKRIANALEQANGGEG